MISPKVSDAREHVRFAIAYLSDPRLQQLSPSGLYDFLGRLIHNLGQDTIADGITKLRESIRTDAESTRAPNAYGVVQHLRYLMED